MSHQTTVYKHLLQMSPTCEAWRLKASFRMQWEIDGGEFFSLDKYLFPKAFIRR